jgi:hypothetical protein
VILSRSLVALLAVVNVVLADALLASLMSTRPTRSASQVAAPIAAPVVPGRGADPLDSIDANEPVIGVY